MKKLLTFGFIFIVAVSLTGCFKKKEETPPVVVQPNVEAPEVLSVAEGDTVGVMYVGSLENGEVFDTNIVATAKEAGIYNEMRPYEPLTFTVGGVEMSPGEKRLQVIPGFDKGVIGMKVGETKTLNIPVEDGYGAYRADLVQTFPTSDFDTAGVDWQAWEVGEKYNFGGLQGTITEKTEENVTIDFNHFLADKNLVFEVTMESISK